MDVGVAAVGGTAVNGLNGPVARAAVSGRSGLREGARASVLRHPLVQVGCRVGVGDAVGRRAEPRAPVSPAILALVPLAATGDKAAFTRLVETFHADMARLAYFVCGGNRELSEDAVQAAWAIAWSRLASLRDPERIRAWLLSVTANEARQLLRRQRQVTTVRLEFAEDRVGTHDPYASSGALDMRRVLARLKPEERTLIGLRYAAGLDSAEIGTVLGMSASGVRSRLDRLLDRLRAELEHE
jgi:RNA polymerase sigma-70 factor, ECF subfamily